MGYDVHIIRSTHWTESEQRPITLEEWCTYIRDDGEMRLDGFADATTPDGASIRYENPGLAVWVACSRPPSDGFAWFDYQEGRIVVKNADDEIIAKMIKIARTLGARVQGDDGEWYDAPPASARGSEHQLASKPWWRRLLGN